MPRVPVQKVELYFNGFQETKTNNKNNFFYLKIIIKKTNKQKQNTNQTKIQVEKYK